MKKSMGCRALLCLAALFLCAGCAEKGAAVPEKKIADPVQEAAVPADEVIRIDLSKGQKEGPKKEKLWQIRKEPKYGDAELLCGRLWHTSSRMPIEIKKAGPYQIQMTFYTEKDKAGNMLAVFRNPQGEVMHCEKVDTPHHGLNGSRPYLGYALTRPEGAKVVKFNCTFEFPGVYTLEIKGNPAKWVTLGRSGYFIDSIYAVRLPVPVPAVPKGFIPAPVLPLHTNLYTGIRNPRERFQAGLIQNSLIYNDIENMVSLGVNFEHGVFGGQNEKYGVYIMVDGIGAGISVSKDFVKEHPKPEGRFVNAEGSVSGGFSLAYDPAIQESERRKRDAFKKRIDEKAPSAGPMVLTYSVAGEGGGNMDYSPAAQEKFRNVFLKNKYKSIEALNKAWRTEYKSFDEIQAAKSPEESKPCYFEYRDFCGKLYVQAIARAVRLVNAIDPLKRKATTQCSNFDFGAAGFFKYRPVDVEELILDGLKETDNFGWDGYCADDYMGMETDFASSFARGKKIHQREHNVHSPDWRIGARTYWTMVGKGIKGVDLFQYHQGDTHYDCPKWGLTNEDMSPRDKLLAYSDAMHEVHHLENILMSAKKEYQTKPVALYFSRIDMQLKGKPVASAWSEGIDPQYHVYEMLRGRGYNVTAITPRQIRDGFLKNVGAVVLVDCQHIAADVVKRMMDWTKQGGVLIADTWPGGYNDLGIRQDQFMDFFGFKPIPPKKEKVETIKLEESVQGYGEVTLAAINKDEDLVNSALEIWQQWDSKHPVSKAMGNFMFSGYGLQLVECTAGEVVAMTFDAYPGAIINAQGKGQTLYFSSMLGSYYGGSATRYEWDSTHQANDPARLLDEFLKFAGVRKGASAGLPERIAYKLRVEAPLIDAKGNAVVTLQSYNDDVLRPFPLSLAWKKDRPAPEKIFAAVGGSRKLVEVPFKRTEEHIELTMPGFDSHATLLLLRDAAPVISLDFPDAVRGIGHLIDMTPSQAEKVIVKVLNPSPKKLGKGKIELRLPEGWLCSAASADVPEIAPFGSASVELKIMSPAFCSMKRARPLTFVYRSGDVESMPATEVVRWMPAENKQISQVK